MQREIAILLYDVAETCREIEQFSTGETRSSVLGNRGLHLALQKLVEIVGETLDSLSRMDPDTALLIPDLQRCVDFGIKTSRDYDTVDYAIVWEVVSQEIPNLLSNVTLLLQDAPPLSV